MASTKGLQYTQDMGTPADELPSPEAAKILEQALQLPRREQEYLAARLRFAVPTDEQGWPEGLHPEWKDELARRLESLENGSATLIDGDEHLKHLLAKYGA